MISLKGSLSFCSYPPIPRSLARRRPRSAAHIRRLARVLALAIASLEIAFPAVSVRDDGSINQCRESHRECSSQASCLPQSPERPDDARVDDPLFHGRGNSDCKIKHPENRLEHLYAQKRPRMQSANEPQADFCGCEQDADEHEGYADNPSSVAKSWVSGTGLKDGLGRVI
jgi:hypothetical protein